MRVLAKNKVAVVFGLLLYASLALAQNLQPGGTASDYRPLGALIFRENNSILSREPASAYVHAGYVLYISMLQGALLDTNPGRIEEQAQILEISPADIERVYLLLNEFNTRLTSSRRAILEEECAPLLAGMSLTNAEMRAAVAHIDADEPREEILQDVLQNVRDAFGDDVVSRIQSRVSQISRSPQFFRLQQLEQMVRMQSGGDAVYLNELCAILRE